MNFASDVVHAVIGHTFVMSFHDLSNDKTTVKLMVTKDKKEICYLDHISSTMKHHGCVSLNVLVDLPEVEHFPVNHLKTSHF